MICCGNTLRSLFVTGTDTDVGKTVIASGLCAALKTRMINVGAAKPFAAGQRQQQGFASKDAQTLANAAGSMSDGESLINSQFFPITASPYTAAQECNVIPDVNGALDAYFELDKLHDVLIVEGMGGVMVPIRKDYCVVDLAVDMRIDVLVICSQKMGSLNHTIMTINACTERGINVAGIIINDIGNAGYNAKILARDIELLTSVHVLGTLDHLNDTSPSSVSRSLESEIDIDKLFLANDS